MSADPNGGESRRDRLWPLIIILGFVLVAAVNIAFIVVAVSGADDVVESYVTEER